MDSLLTQGAQLAPKDAAEAVAVFRAQVIGPLLTRVFASHGELASAIGALSRERYRPPNSITTRTYSQATIERWYSAEFVVMRSASAAAREAASGAPASRRRST